MKKCPRCRKNKEEANFISTLYGGQRRRLCYDCVVAYIPKSARASF